MRLEFRNEKNINLNIYLGRNLRIHIIYPGRILSTYNTHT